MKRVICLLVLASTAWGINYDGLRVKFGWSDALADVEYFFKIPRTIPDAEAEGWKRTQRPQSPLSELRMYCPPGRAVCPLYDTAGFVAGLQLSFPVGTFETPAIRPEQLMGKWRAPAADGEPAKEYWYQTQYFVSSESLKAGAGPTVENGATLQDGGVWVYGPDLRLMRIPSTEAELNSTAFKKQNCIPNMGTHYYYNMTPELICDSKHFLPWFALVTEGELIGTGFQMFGRLTKQMYMDWFEIIPAAKQSAQVTIPYASQCILDWAASGVVSLHIYYVDQPWNIRCKTGDSAKPGSAIDRLMLNGYRYASQLTDEFKRLFSG